MRRDGNGRKEPGDEKERRKAIGCNCNHKNWKWSKFVKKIKKIKETTRREEGGGCERIIDLEIYNIETKKKGLAALGRKIVPVRRNIFYLGLELDDLKEIFEESIRK